MLIPKERKPTTPAELVQEYLLDEFEITQGELAQALNVTRQTVSRLLKGHSKVSIEMAFRLSALTKTSPELWLNSQLALDLWEGKQLFLQKIEQEVKPIQGI